MLSRQRTAVRMARKTLRRPAATRGPMAIYARCCAARLVDCRETRWLSDVPYLAGLLAADLGRSCPGPSGRAARPCLPRRARGGDRGGWSRIAAIAAIGTTQPPRSSGAVPWPRPQPPRRSLSPDREQSGSRAAARVAGAVRGLDRSSRARDRQVGKSGGFTQIVLLRHRWTDSQREELAQCLLERWREDAAGDQRIARNTPEYLVSLRRWSRARSTCCSSPMHWHLPLAQFVHDKACVAAWLARALAAKAPDF